MFGFTRLASYDYFAHVERALRKRFADAGHGMVSHVSGVLPTASVRRRATKLRALIESSYVGDGPIHLVGHSTGGLDARLVMSPAASIASEQDSGVWFEHVRSVTTMNTPHYGTPLASFFATSRGQQALYLLSAFTVVGLSVGATPLAIMSALIGLVTRGDSVLGLRVLDRSMESLLALVDDARSPELRNYLKAITNDQGAVLQLSPEAMDLMLAGFADRPGVLYQSTVSMSPMPGPMKWLRTFGRPMQAASLALFTALHQVTANYDKRYPCGAFSPEGKTTPSTADPFAEALLMNAFGVAPDLRANDGCVPLRSQIWGKLVWAGLGDHLDVLGHYRDDTPEQQPQLRHHDWLASGSQFDDARFASLMDAIARGMLNA